MCVLTTFLQYVNKSIDICLQISVSSLSLFLCLETILRIFLLIS